MAPDLNDLYVDLLLSSIIIGDSNASGPGILTLAKAMVMDQDISEVLRDGVVAKLSTQRHVSNARLIKDIEREGFRRDCLVMGNFISLLSK